MTIETAPNHVTPSVQKVAIRSEPPTTDELWIHDGPARFTWLQLKTIVKSGNLGLLKRDEKLQYRYDQWTTEIKRKYGSVVDYLVNHELQWGKPDTPSQLTSSLGSQSGNAIENREQGPYPTPEYFKADIPFDSVLICVRRNYFPYAVPPEVEHFVIWSRVPIFHPALIPPTIGARIQRNGLCGFTGSTDMAGSHPSLESCHPSLADYGTAEGEPVRSAGSGANGARAAETMAENAGKEVREFVRQRWTESRWETAWFVNPPRLQSILDLAHIHVFARRKTAEEEAVWQPVGEDVTMSH